MTIDNLCEFCKEQENLTHLIFDCPRSSEAWNNFNISFNYLTNIQVSFTKTDIIFGFHSIKGCVILNSIATKIKQSICQLERTNNITIKQINNMFYEQFQFEKHLEWKNKTKLNESWALFNFFNMDTI